MGNSKTKVGVVIQTEKNFYLPGEIVRGHVFINSPKPYPASKIILYILGMEKNWWKESSDVQNNKVESVANSGSATSIKTVDSAGRKKMKPKIEGDRKAQCKIIQASFLLTSWNNQSFLHGQYAFPFEFMLPSYIPGSFKEQSQKYQAQIYYQIKTIISSHRKEFPTIEQTHQFIVRQNRKTIEQSLYGQVYLYPQTCFCFKKGVSKICCYFEKNQYLPGQQCVAICEVDNFKCQTGIDEVKVKFIKQVTLMSAFGEERVFTEQINNISFPGTPALTMYAGQLAKRQVIPLKYRRSNNPIHPSTSGRYVKCEYHIQVTPVVSGCCVKSGQYFSVRLNILQAGLLNEQIKQPDNWKPEVYMKSEIILQSNHQNQGLNKMNQNY